MNSYISDKALIQALKKNVRSRNRAIERIFRNLSFKRRITSHLIQNGCNREEAEEVFDDGVLNFVKNVMHGNYHSDAPIENYLFSICKYLGYKKMRKPAHQTTEELTDKNTTIETEDPETLLIKKEMHITLVQILHKLGEPGCTALSMWAIGHTYKEIAKELGISEPYARLRVLRCRRKIEQILKEHPEYELSRY